jgi:integrase
VRPRHQSGTIVRKGRNWVLRYYEDRIVDGHVERVRASQVLAPCGNVYRNKTDVKDLAQRALAKLPSAGGSIDGALTLGDFIENKYFPHIEQRTQMQGELHLEPSTVKGYRDIWKFHGKGKSISTIRLRDFGTEHGQAFLMALDQSLNHKTHLRIKAFLSGVFRYAKQFGAIVGVNPMDDTKAGGSKKKFQGVAYTLDTIQDMLEKLPEPSRTVCAVAAFTGLSASELRGLRWSDYDGKNLTVSQKVWRTHVGQPKTEARSGAVPVIPVLKKILDRYREQFPPNGSDFIFRGEKMGFALNLDNVSRRDIAPIMGEKWAGWHSFRRGLGTRLFYLGTDAKTVQTILRHANVSTTLANYVIPDPVEAQAAMAKFNRVLKRVIVPKSSPQASGSGAKQSRHTHKQR